MYEQDLQAEPATGASATQRDRLFISHAYPEDNEFARWLALQLANEGYPVWSDLTNLLGGEIIWDDVQRTIKEKAAKVIFVHSRHSNQRDGTLQEIHLAKAVIRSEGLENFIIPLRIDPLLQDEIAIQLQRIAPIDFHQSWAEGLAQLLKKLEDDRVPRDAKFNPQTVSIWWRKQFSADYGVLEETEEVLSNWYPITDLPETINLHSLQRTAQRTAIGKIGVATDLPYPAVQDGLILLSFAGAEDFAGKLGDDLTITSTRVKPIKELLEGENRREFKKHLAQLLREAWEKMIKARGLPQYTFANKAQCGYFTSGMVAKDTLYFTGVNGEKAHRSVVGYKSVPGPVPKESVKRYWHFGIQGKLIQYPIRAYVMKPHVLFSSDGKEIWTSKPRLARARRNQCNNWWNDEWRDRITATITWLAGGEAHLKVPLGSDVFLEVQKCPLLFESPVSYLTSDEELHIREEEAALPDYEYEEDLYGSDAEETAGEG